MADQDRRRVSRLVFFGSKRAARCRADSEQPKKSRCSEPRLQPFRFAHTGQITSTWNVDVSRHLGKASALAAKIQKITRRQLNLRKLRKVSIPDLHERSGIAVRQWLQEHTFDHAENRRIRADAKPKRQYGHRGESRTLPQRSKRMPQILPKGFHRIPRSLNL